MRWHCMTFGIWPEMWNSRLEIGFEVIWIVALSIRIDSTIRHKLRMLLLATISFDEIHSILKTICSPIKLNPLGFKAIASHHLYDIFNAIWIFVTNISKNIDATQFLKSSIFPSSSKSLHYSYVWKVFPADFIHFIQLSSWNKFMQRLNIELGYWSNWLSLFVKWIVPLLSCSCIWAELS